VDNLWNSGPSGGRRDYPDFGQDMSKHEFKCFQSAAAFYWYLDRRDKPWEVFLPCLVGFNERRRNLLKTVLLMLDKSMSGWRPKTSKLGGLPNYTFESRRPIPIGTMFKMALSAVLDDMHSLSNYSLMQIRICRMTVKSLRIPQRN
jgi:hypothetical protein